MSLDRRLPLDGPVVMLLLVGPMTYRRRIVALLDVISPAYCTTAGPKHARRLETREHWHIDCSSSSLRMTLIKNNSSKIVLTELTRRTLLKSASLLAGTSALAAAIPVMASNMSAQSIPIDSNVHTSRQHSSHNQTHGGLHAGP
jgi:hypothetical protein